ncbi:transcriptional regulator [Streptomyces sp. SDT5-1]|uniref:transcriptional regulator n=1 Tax=Streptomyces sp. SDT5-1 TaxID=3406418 RepID=UPI003FD0235F
MPAHSPGGALTADAPEPGATMAGACHIRLAVQLAKMVPGATALQVTLREPGRAWPSPHASAWDANGRRIPLNAARARIAARWIIRCYPEANWRREQRLDLRTASLRSTPSEHLAARGGR